MKIRPYKIAIYIWTTIALLGVISWAAPDNGGWTIGKFTLRWPTISKVLDKEKPNQEPIVDFIFEDDSLSIDPLANAIDTIVSVDSLPKPKSTNIPTIATSDTDTRQYLTAFYQALDSTDVMSIRVVHYGDSQIEEDRITSILREKLQTTYGGGGVGLIPLHQTIPTRSLQQTISMNGVVQTTKGGPKRYLVYGPRSMRLEGDNYGVMGQVAVMDCTLVQGSENITMNIAPLYNKPKSHNYFNQLRILADSISVSITNPNIDSLIIVDQSSLLVMPDSTTHCELHLEGKGAIYGISLETKNGIIVDNIPMRGSSGNMFTRIDSTALHSFFDETNTRLIILQFGGNMIPNTENPSTISGYVKTLRQQVRYMRACAPQASILFIGPSDMSTRIDGTMTTYPLVPYLDMLLEKMAQEEQIGYWSMYNAMGGYNSMVDWNAKGLAGNDYVHFTRSGANKIGTMLYTWLTDYTPSTQPTDSLQTDTTSL